MFTTDRGRDLVDDINVVGLPRQHILQDQCDGPAHVHPGRATDLPAEFAEELEDRLGFDCVHDPLVKGWEAGRAEVVAPKDMK